MAKSVKGRPVHGVVLVNKPSGRTSNALVQRIKYLTKARRVGHTGALDPMATGLLPIVFGFATRFSQYGLDADKGYETLVQLGVTTTTQDAEGAVLETCPVPHFDLLALEAVLARFRGQIEQVPPAYAALKKDGKRWYRLARAGVEFDRPTRSVTIHRLDLLHYDRELGQLRLAVACSKGTYIRALAHDIGAALGVGGHVAELTRTAVGDDTLADAVDWAVLESACVEDPEAIDQWLRPIDALIARLPRLEVTLEDAFLLSQGQKLFRNNIDPCHTIAVFASDHGFLGICAIDKDGRLCPRRMLASIATGMRGEAGIGPFGSGMPDEE
ncbi:MAG: tRNA pseudouridine(55) synthase TruB [Litorivicinaceae bacterium]|nr:tRNA pseudouridine(55) synthase TruB [Litorivicinaceae bacterium]